MKVVWTKQAQRDLQAIYDYIALDSPHYAARVIDTLLETETRIGEFPASGSLVRERQRSDIRQVRRYSYRIIYRILRSRIDVLTVVHQRRELSPNVG